MKTKLNFPKLRQFLASQNDVVFAYIYGSALKGFFNEESDVDVAVFLSGSPNNFFNRRLELGDALSKITKKETNVAVLNQVSSLFLKFVILTEGKIIYEKKHSERLDFEVKNMNFYYDYEPFLNSYNKKYLEKNI